MQATPCALLVLLLAFLFTSPDTVAQQQAPEYFTSVEQRNQWVASIRRRIGGLEENIEFYTRRIHTAQEQLRKSGLPRLHYEHYEEELRDYTRYLEDAKRKKAEFERLLRSIPPVRDLEAERREAQELAAKKAAAQPPPPPPRQQSNPLPPPPPNGFTSRPPQKQKPGQVIANAITEGFNRQLAAAAAEEQMREERERRERKLQEEFNESVRQEAAMKASPATVYVPPPAEPLQVPPAEPYVPPAPKEVVQSQYMKEFAAVVFQETGAILLEALEDQANEGQSLNLGDAAWTGIKNLPERTFEAIIEDTVNTAKDAIYNAAVNLLPPDRQTDLRALQLPFVFLTRNFELIADTYFTGENSLWQRNVAGQVKQFTVGDWPR